MSISRLSLRLLQFVIRIWQLALSPMLGNRCRFYPSCSEYASKALNEYGVMKGLKLGTLRILKCHPFHPGGVDMVPERNNKSK